MAMVVTAHTPPAIVEQVRYRHRYYKARRRVAEPGVAPYEANVIVEQEVPTEKGPVIFMIKPIVNPDRFEDRWEGKGDRLR
jgi:hypothetical protein